MSNEPLIALTGVSGVVGGKVASRLAKFGKPLRLIARDASRVPSFAGSEVRQSSFEDSAAMQAALNGVQTLFLVPGTAEDRLKGHFTTIEAAQAAGVERIVYLSFLACAPLATFTHSREHYQTEDFIRSKDLRYTFLRPNFYLDAVAEWFSPEGVLKGPADKGTISWVSRDDIADVVVHVLTTSGHDGNSYDITGSQAITLAQTADILSQVAGRPTSYQPETLEEAKTSRAQYNPSVWTLEAWLTTYLAIATGELSVVSQTVQAFTGHAPQSLADYLKANPQSYQHIKTA